MEAATNSLLNEQAKRKERGISMQSEANVIENCGRNDKRRRNNGRGRSMGRSKSLQTSLLLLWQARPSEI